MPRHRWSQEEATARNTDLLTRLRRDKDAKTCDEAADLIEAMLKSFAEIRDMSRGCLFPSAYGIAEEHVGDHPQKDNMYFGVTG